MSYSRNDDDKHPIASARRLVSFMPPKRLEWTQDAGVVNENPGPDIALTIVYRTYGNPHRGGYKIKISHFVLDPIKLNQIELDLEQVVATQVKRFQAVEGRSRDNWGEDHVTRVRVHPQAIVEISSSTLKPPELRAILESLDLDGLAQSCRAGTIFERTTLDRLSDSLVGPEIMERLLPARIGAIAKTKVWSRRQREDPFMRTYV